MRRSSVPFPSPRVQTNISRERMMTTQKDSPQLTSGRHTAWVRNKYLAEGGVIWLLQHIIAHLD